MAKVIKNIGKLPVHKGAWVQGTAYARLNQVTYEGSCLQSKVDNNTAQPITISGSTFTVNASWQMISDGTTPKLKGDKAEMQGEAVAGQIFQMQQSPTGVRLLKSMVIATGGANTLFMVINIPKDWAGNVVVFNNSNIRVWLNNAKYLILQEGDKSVNFAAKIGTTLEVAITVLNGNIWLMFPSIGGYKSMPSEFNSIQDLTISSGLIIHNIKTLNIGVDETLLYTLYNQGRFDELVFGQEWKEDKTGGQNVSFLQTQNVVNNNGVFTFANLPSSIGEWLTSQSINLSPYRMVEVSFDYTAENDVRVELNDVGLANYTKQGKYVDLQAGSGRARIIGYVEKYISLFKESAIGGLVLSNISFRQVAIKNEYKKEGIMPSRWLDFGATKNDVDITGSTPLFTSMYEENTFSSSAPTAPPTAALCKHSQINGAVWISGAKTKDRPYNMNDWKQVTN